ncbi:MAG: hypothetical protein HRU38_17570 [Saccharospirillaceae bacterium]|nr:hypothetical protein [Pseudomonadales bacterium]NRB80449.1 hypothetical protein [Saccharospirillaceae bacterium]
MRHKEKNYKVSVLFLLSLIIALLLFYIGGPAMQARQVLRDVEHYIKLKEMAPSIVQLRKQSATFRNSPNKCPCYKRLSIDRFEIMYLTRFKQIMVYDNKTKKWIQSNPK